MSGRLLLLTAVGSALVVLMIMQGSLGLNSRNSELLDNLQRIHNQLYNRQNRTFNQTLLLFQKIRSIYNNGTDQFKTLIEASEISEKRCNGNFSLHYDRLIRENSFDPNTSVTYLKQCKLAQEILCLRINIGKALVAIGEENRVDMENLAKGFGQSRSDHTGNPVLAFLQEKVGPICTDYVRINYRQIYNRTIGRMVELIKRKFSPLLVSDDLQYQVDLNLRLTRLEMEWLFSYAPMAAQLDAYPSDAANATYRDLLEYCEDLDIRREAVPGLYDRINSTLALMQSIAKHCSTDRNIGTIVFPLNKAKFIDGLVDFIKQMSGPPLLDREEFELYNVRIRDECLLFQRWLRIDRTDIQDERQNLIEQAAPVCRYIINNHNGMKNETYTVYLNSHSLINRDWQLN